MRPFYLLPLLSAAVGASIVAPTSLTISIPTSPQLSNPDFLLASTHATLTALSQPNGAIKVPLTRYSTFEFGNIAPLPNSDPNPNAISSYLLDIHSRDYAFAPYRVDVSQSGAILGVWEINRGYPWTSKGIDKLQSTTSENGQHANQHKLVIEARVLGKKEFYEQREKFSPLSLLKNPMILLAGFAMLVTLGMPYLLDNMDPEMREEFEKQRSGGSARGAGKAGADIAKAPGFDLAGWMAGTTSSPLDTGRSSTGPEVNPASAMRRRA